MRTSRRKKGLRRPPGSYLEHRKCALWRCIPPLLRSWGFLSAKLDIGYSLAIILQSCIQHQASTPHIDPLHISAHFLRPTKAKLACKVYVHTLKSGKGFTNLVADLYQEDVLRITAHAIFGLNARTPDDPNPILAHPSPYARRTPLFIHPSQGTFTDLGPIWTFQNNVSWAFDHTLIAQNAPSHPSRVSPPDIGGTGLEWGGYLQFNTPSERLSSTYIPFLVDMFQGLPNLLPPDFGYVEDQSWFPTMTLAVQFNVPMSSLSPEKHSMRTVGLYSDGRFLNPQGRHDVYVEVWSAPSNIGEGTIKEGWRDEQVCLASATQMALVVPVAVNMRNATQTPSSKL